MHTAGAVGARISDPARPTQEPMSSYCLVHTSDVTQAEQAGGQFLSENHLRLASTDDFDARIHGVSMDSVSLFYMNYGAQLEVIAPPLGDYIALVLPLTGRMDVQVGDDRFDVTAGATAGMIADDRPLRMRWNSEFSMLCARIDVSALANHVRSLDPTGAERPVVFAPTVSRPAALDAVWGAARVIVDVFERLAPSQRPAPLIAAQMSDQLLTALVLTQPNSHSVALWAPAPAVAHAAVRRAVELIASKPELPHTVASIAKAVGVSPRGLHAAFRRDMGTTPACYLTQVRLDRAHRQLTAADRADRTIADVAAAWGFSNPGRFAAYYRRRFGQPPSATLGSRTHRGAAPALGS
jgi:AraC-like DNA-binding protein